MRSQRKFLGSGSSQAQVGIGTMIVFIATVLVAAIAAGVLIQTSEKLQERSSRTGEDASQQVSSTLSIDSVVGKRDAAGDAGLKDLELYVSLSPGAREMDLGQLKVQLQNGTELKTFDHADVATPGANQFNTSKVRDADGSFTSADPVMTPGDLVKIRIRLANNGMEFAPRQHVIVVLLPEIGNQVTLEFNTPTSFGQNTVTELH